MLYEVITLGAGGEAGRTPPRTRWQRPEVHDRQPVGIDRPLGALGDEVVHDGEEAGGQEESYNFV